VGKVICDYMAFKEDEISVSKGEVVQILYTNQHNMFLVHRPANATPKQYTDKRCCEL
jgi:hypothetical protein